MHTHILPFGFPVSSSSTSSTLITSVCAVQSGATPTLLVGDSLGRVTFLPDSKNASSASTASAFSFDAQVGPVQGISCRCLSSATSAPSVIAVHGRGDASVNVFVVEIEADSGAVAARLRCKCVGHLFGASATSFIGGSLNAAVSTPPLLLTCGRDGVLRLFDLQRGGGKSNNNVDGVVSLTAVSQTSALPCGVVPTAIAVPAVNTPLDQRGNVVVMGTSKKKTDSDDDDTIFFELDILGHQRASTSYFGGVGVGGGGIMGMSFTTVGASSSSSAFGGGGGDSNNAPEITIVQSFTLSELVDKSSGAADKQAILKEPRALAWSSRSRSLRVSRSTGFAGIPLQFANAAAKNSVDLVRGSRDDDALLLASSQLPAGTELAAVLKSTIAALEKQTEIPAQRSKAARQQSAVLSALGAIVPTLLGRRERGDNEEGEVAAANKRIAELEDMISELSKS